MQLINIDQIEGEVFPAGRRSRIVAGPKGLPVEQFALGQSTLFANGGAIPPHKHANEEVYIILSGVGQMQVGDEIRPVTASTAIYIPPNIEHSLVNNGQEPLLVQWIYAPGGLVDHWAEERSGDLK